jgi:hypothetical protein
MRETQDAAADIMGRALPRRRGYGSRHSSASTGSTSGVGGESKVSPLPRRSPSSASGNFSLRKNNKLKLSLPSARASRARASLAASGSASAGAMSSAPKTPFVGIIIEAYAAQKPSEMTVDTGDEVRITDTESSEHWWYGTIAKKGLQGWLPRSILLCDGVATPRGTGVHGSLGLGISTTITSKVKRSAPMPVRLRSGGLSTSMQALISPANARLGHRNKVQGFFREDSGGGGAAATPGTAAAAATAAAATAATAAADAARDDKEPLSSPLRRFLSGHGSQWAEYADAEGNHYYHNPSDDQVCWARPTSAQATRRIRGTDGNAWSQFSLDGGNTFWFEERTGHVAASPPPAERELKSVKSRNGSDWLERVDVDGRVYWYNKTSGMSSFETPELWMQESTRRAQADSGNKDAPECIICMDRKCCVMLLPCAHANYCQECAQRLSECPECRAPITHRQRFFM